MFAMVPLLACLSTAIPAPPDQETLELIRDTWGVPHVFATSDRGAMYGLGFASAEDRAFQMYLNLRVMQGRLAETLGNVRHRNGRSDAVQSDIKARTFGWWQHAQHVAARLDPESRALLQAYADGVNAWLAAQEDELPEPFGTVGLVPEPWTPAASLVSWWRLAQFFGPDGTRDLIAWRNRDRQQPVPNLQDDEVAVVRRGDVSDAWVDRVAAYVREHALAVARKPNGEGRKFSHAWVVGGAKTTTGSAVLCSDPQTPVANPSLLYEFHVHGATFDARGVGVAGSPIVLIGFNRDVAWGMTARGADQADLFRLESGKDIPELYFVDGEVKAMEVRDETIRIRGEEPRKLRVRSTVFGPEVTALAFAQPGEPVVAVKRVPLCDVDVETIQGGIAMLRAHDIAEFNRALAGWRFPSANCVYGDRSGAIGYATIGAIPLRSAAGDVSGRTAHDGTARRFDWKGFVPFELMPQLTNPRRGYILSANHRPIADFYRIPIGAATGTSGDTIRSWRLRELLQAKDRFSPEDVLAVHYDTINPARREIARIGYHIRDSLGLELGKDAMRALEHLEPWFERGAPGALDVPGAALASHIDIMFRFTATPLTTDYGGGQSGLTRLLRTTQARFMADPKALFDPLEWEWADRLLGQAWQAAVGRWGRDPGAWEAAARRDVTRARLGWFESLDGFPSLDRGHDVQVPPLRCVDGNTILSQRAQAYSQWVPLHDVDQAKALCPPGQSERLGDPSRLGQLTLWSRGELRAAPLSRAAVDRIRTSLRELSY